MLLLLLLLIASIIIERSDAFITPSRGQVMRLPARVISPPVLRMIETINLEPLGDDHEAEGTRIAKSIAGWLDMEWCPQEVHRAIAEDVKKTYVRARQDGDDCVSSLMHEVAESLQSNWSEYDKDAFVNAYDIANYFSDFLSIRAGELDLLQWIRMPRFLCNLTFCLIFEAIAAQYTCLRLVK